MNITNKLIEEAVWFETTTGQKPERVYLGKQEHTELCYDARQYVHVGEPRIEEGERLEWRGMKVYEVDAQNHIGFGRKADSPCG